MRNIYRGAIFLLLISAAIGVMAVEVSASEWYNQPGCACNAAPIPDPVTVDNTYMGLSQGPLRFALLSALPQGVLLRTGKETITDEQLAADIAKARPVMQLAAKKNGFYVLEQMGIQLMMTAEARAWATETKRDTAKDTDAILMKAYLESIGAAVTVSDVEVESFYEANKDMVGGAPFKSVAKDMKSYLLMDKRQRMVDAHVNNLSAMTLVEVDREWLKGQAITMLDNMVDNARRSGKVSMIDFGREGCGPCDLMTPILNELSKEYAEKCNILFCHTGDNPLLASRYSITSIPIQVFFDKDGKEVFRHVGFFPKDQIVAKLAELGVK